jgi:hypothetical protein
LSPSRSTNSGDAAPSLVSFFGKPSIMSWSRCRKRLRRSSPVRTVGPSTLRATILSVKPYGSVLGRPLDVCSVPTPGSRWRKSPVFAGKRALSAATSREATTPSNDPVRAVVPSQCPEGTWRKSPPAVVSALLGDDPGATSTRQV